jgi:hypothetical protein
MEGDQAKRWRLVKDGQPIDDNLATDWWSSQRPVISNDGSRCGYVLWDDPDISAVINGTKSAPFKNVWGITLPSAAERGRFKSAFAASDGSEWSFVVNGTPDSAKFTSAYAPTIAIDGSHLVCRAKRDNSQWLVVDQVAVDGVQNVISGPMFLNRSMQVNPAAPTNVIWVVQEGKELFRVTSSL